MSIKWMMKTWEDQVLEGSERLTMLALADNANDEGVCWPSQTTIARKVRLSVSQTTRVLKSLEERGYIRREPGGGRKSTVYQLLTPRVDAGGEEDTPRVDDKAAPAPVLGQPPHSYATRTIIEPSLNQVSLTQPADIDPIDRWVEGQGLMMTPDNIEAKKRMTSKGATLADFEAALAWRMSPQGPRTPIRNLAQLENGVETSRLKRVQASTPGKPYGKPAKESLDDRIARLERERKAKVAQRRAAEEAEKAAYGHDNPGTNTTGEADRVAAGVALIGQRLRPGAGVAGNAGANQP